MAIRAPDGANKSDDEDNFESQYVYVYVVMVMTSIYFKLMIMPIVISM